MHKAFWLTILSVCFPIIAQEGTNFVGFSQTEYRVNEAVPAFSIVARREGDTSTTVSVDYRFASENAVVGVDYETSQGTLTFAPGETNKAIFLSIVDDNDPEGTKTISAYLTNIIGDSVLTNSQAVIHLIDNDGRPNGIDPSFSFITKNVTVVNDVVPLSSGEFSYAGEGSAYHGVVNYDGTLSQTLFAFGPGSFKSLVVDPQEGILRAGFESMLGPIGRAANNLYDFDFWVNVQSLGGAGKKIFVNSKAEIIAAGNFFYTSNSSNTFGLVAFDRTGHINAKYQGSSAGFAISAAAMDTTGNVYAAYSYTNETSNLVYSLGKWKQDGSRDTNFSGLSTTSTPTVARIPCMVLEPDESALLVAVENENGSGLPETRLTRLFLNGSVDTNYDQIPVIHGRVKALAFRAWQPVTIASNAYDTVYIGGEFSGAGEFDSTNLIAFKSNGQSDWSFPPGEGANGAVNVILPLSDGSLMVGGAFTEFSGYPASGLVRLRGIPQDSVSLVYFDHGEYRGYEQTGETTLTISRAGSKLNEPLTVNLQYTTTNSAGSFEVPQSFEFAPGEVHKSIVVALPQDALPGTKEARLQLSTGDPSISITHADATLKVLDDETPGTLDTSYHSDLDHAPTAFEEQPDSSLLVGYISGRPKLARLKGSGSLDTSFIQDGFPVTTTGFGIAQIQSISSGNIYVSGNFTDKSEGNRSLLVRLNSDGSLDTNFNPGLKSQFSAPGATIRFLTQPDGKLLIYSSETFLISNSFIGGIARLYSDGSLDTTFQTAFSTSPGVSLIALQDNGSVITYSSKSAKLQRLTSTGALDRSLDLTIRGNVAQMLIVDDTLLICGAMRTINANPVSSLVKLSLTDGSIDPGVSISADGDVTRILPLQSGKYLVSGNFTQINGKDRYRIARLNSDFSLDETFETGFGLNFEPAVLAELTDRKVLVGGSFTKVDLVPALGVVRLLDVPSTGEIRLVSHQLIFDQTEPFAKVEVERVDGSAGELSATLSTLDLSAVAGLNYEATNTVITYSDGEYGRKSLDIPLTPNQSGSRTFAVRFHNGTAPDQLVTVLINDPHLGAVDPAFQISAMGGTNPPIHEIVIDNDGKFLVGGSFTNIQNTPMSYVAKLNADLSLDTNFVLTPNESVNAILPFDDGSLLIGGLFKKVGTNSIPYIARLKADQTIDKSFNSNKYALFSSQVNGLGARSASELYAWSQRDFLRFTNGNPDMYFQKLGANAVEILAAGELLVAQSSGLARMSSTGKVDVSFKVTTQFRSSSGLTSSVPVLAVCTQSDGSTLVGGSFEMVNKEPGSRLVRITPDGVLDPAFLADVGTNSFSLSSANYVSSIQVLANRQILVGGNFRTIEGFARPLLARLNPDGTLDRNFNPDLKGDRVDKIKLLRDGSVIVLGGITNVNGMDVDGIFRLSAITNLAPEIRYLWPTDGALFYTSRLNSNAIVNVQAFDPDGFLKAFTLALDGNVVSTKVEGPYEFPLPENLAIGTHEIIVSAEDQAGLVTKKAISFEIRELPLNVSVAAEFSNGNLNLHITAPMFLESSDDLIHWARVDGGSAQTEFVISDLSRSRQRFYRAVSGP